MKKTTPINIVLIVLIIFCFQVQWTNQRKNGVTFFQTSSLLSNIENGDVIVGVRTFLTLFVWKSKFNESELALVSSMNNHDESRSFLMNWLTNNTLTVGTRPDFTKLLSKYFDIYHLPISKGDSSLKGITSTCNNIYLHVDMCQRRNYMRKFDSILLDPYMFSFYVRFYRDVQITNGKLMETSDFIAFPLIPYEVYSISTLKSSSGGNSLFDFEKTSCTNGPEVSDAQTFRWLTGYSNFSHTDLHIIQGITGTSQLTANYSVISQQVGTFTSNFTDLSYNSILSSLLPSSCYMCETDGCLGEDFSPVLDYWIIPQFVIVFSYFCLFFGLKIYKKPAMIRRIGIPYCSLLGFIIMITFTGLSRTCVGLLYSISIFVTIWWIFIYTATILQFYYLRNLYSLIVKYPKREKVLKILASKKGGIVTTIGLTFFLSVVANCISIFFFVNEDKTLADIYRPAVILIFIILLWIVGLISVIYDVISQRKSIMQDGLRKFFFYDDPFYIRVDLLTLILPVIIAIMSGLENLLSGASFNIGFLTGLFNTLVCLSFTLICGGNALIIEIYKMIRNRNVEMNNSLENDLENSEILKILKEYCEKEFSIENYELFMIMRSLKEKKVVKLDEMKHIESEFIHTYSKFEVNIPSTCKKEFYELMKDCERDGQLGYEILWNCLGPDLLLNLSDTFKRLQGTSTYQKWESVQSYTKHIKDINP